MQTKYIFLLLGIALIALILVNAASAFSIKQNSQTMNQGTMKEMHGSGMMQSMHATNSNMMQMHRQMHGDGSPEEMAKEMQEHMNLSDSEAKEMASHCSQAMGESE